MDNKRIFLYALLAIVCFSLWSAWQKDYGVKPAAKASVSAQQQDQTIPTLAKPKPTPVVTIPARRIIHVQTDVLDVAIDTLGGNVISAKLLKYPLEIKKPDIPVQILSAKPDDLYIAESGLLGMQDHKPLQFKAAQKIYALQQGQKTLAVNLRWLNNQGMSVTKTFVFTQGSYALDVSSEIKNNSTQTWSGQFYTQIKRKKPTAEGGMFTMHSYTGAAISSSETPYEKISYKKMDDQDLSRDIKGGWLAMEQRYFLGAWVPDQATTHHYYSHITNGIYTLGMTNAVTVSAGQQTTVGAKLYVGPEIEENLTPLAKNLARTIDYGWLWLLSEAIFWLMMQIHKFLGNWGWSIVVVTVLIKAVFYKLSETSYVSMAKMREVGPKMKAIKERYGDDRQKMSKATMELYKKEKINPLSGCLPQLIQIPFFIALYYVLLEAVQLRQAPFIFWIHDLSVKDPYFILPVLMGLCMFLTQKITPMSPDPAQQKMMMIMPLFLTVLFASFPAGLTLYWLVNYICTGLQQWYVMRKYDLSHARKKA